MIFTFMWALNMKVHWDYLDAVENLLISRRAKELVLADRWRLERNKTENRPLHKPSKPNLKNPEQLF